MSVQGNQNKESNSPFGAMGIPSHMDDSQKIVISGQRRGHKKTDERVLERKGSGIFFEKMGALIGPSYAMSFFVGAALGLTKIPPPKARRTTKLLLNNYLNSIGKMSSSFGNNVGAAIFMYLFVGKSLSFVL